MCGDGVKGTVTYTRAGRSSGRPQTLPRVTIGLCGPHALLERIVLAAGLPGPAGAILRMTADDSTQRLLRSRLVTAAYAEEHTAAGRASRLTHADAVLFASPAPLEYARRAGVLRSPAVHIELGDGPLVAALLQARQAGVNPARASFDTVSRLEVSHALAALGERAQGGYVREGIASPAGLASYHARLWQLGQSAGAVTCLDEVGQRLAAGGVPVVIVQPSDHAIAAALRTTMLLAEQQVLATAQLAVVLVEIPELQNRWPGRRPPDPAAEELRLAVHGLLVHEAQDLGGSVSPSGDHEFLIVTTTGALAALPGGQQPFVAAAADRLGVTLEVAVGTGRTEKEAEDSAAQQLATAAPGTTRRFRAAGSARLAVAADSARPGPSAVEPGPRPLSRDAAGPSGQAGRHPATAPVRRAARADLPRTSARATTLQPPASAATSAMAGTGSGAGSGTSYQPDSGDTDSLARLRSLETLSRLAGQLTGDGAPVVDAELTGRLLSVTPRTARRQLRALADQGLALALPPRRSNHPGRPRQAYRLVVEKLERSAR